MNRRAYLISLLPAVALFSAAPFAVADTTDPPSQPNVLFIAIDDLRPQLGCYGHSQTISPNIDRLAAEGTLFKRAYCTVPVCGPSRVSVLTGLRTEQSQWSCDSVAREFTTLPALFSKHGYHSISNGKILHIQHDREEDWSETPWRSVAIYHGKGDWAGYNNYGLWLNPESARHVPKGGRGPYCESADQSDSAYQDGRVADKTIADLQRMKKEDKPFFLACGFWRPHLPFNAPQKYWDLYEREKIALADNRFRPADLPGPCRTSTEIDRYKLAGARKATEEFHREARHAYYACVSFVDAQVGRVLKALDDLELADNTVVVLWGDHGWNLGEHDFWGKHNTLHNCLHAPLVIRAPGRKTNNTADALVEFVDIYPTLCELTGIPTPQHVEGRSVAPLLDRGDLKWKSAAFCQWSKCQAVKTDRYLYTEWTTGEKMLFDHHEDPQENKNIAGQPSAAKIVKEHSQLLKDGWRKVGPDGPAGPGGE